MVVLNRLREFETLEDTIQPNPNPGFETEIISEITDLAGALPTGTAELRISRVPGHPEWPEPYFEIIPINPNSAPLRGTAVATDLNLTVGNSWREFYGFSRGGTVIKRASWQEEIRCIWRAIVAGKFTEHLTLDSSGKVIAWDSTLVVSGKEVVFRNGHRRKFFGRGQERVETVTYEPYVRG